MTQRIFEVLKKNDLVKRGKVRRATVAGMPFARLVSVVESIVDETRQLPKGAASVAISHAATHSLSGGRRPCKELDCRLLHVRTLARFATMLSDRVYTYNFFADHRTDHELKDGAIFREAIHDDLVVLLEMKPLFDAGLVVPFSPATSCPHCFALRHYGSDFRKRLDTARRKLERDYRQNVKLSLGQYDSEYGLTFEAPEGYFEHDGGGLAWSEPPPPLSSMPRLLRRLADGEEVTLSANARRKFNFETMLARDFVRDIGFEMAVSQSLRAAFLTSIPRQVDFLRSITPGAVTDSAKLPFTQLEAAVPFLAEVDIQDLLKIRSRENAAFVRYRHAFTKAVQEFQKASSSPDRPFTRHDAETFHADVLAPELAKLERAISLAKRDVATGATRQFVGWTAVVAVGLYLGIVPAEFVAAAKALGLAKVAKDALENLYKHRTSDRKAREQDFYFLWRVKNLSK